MWGSKQEIGCQELNHDNQLHRMVSKGYWELAWHLCCHSYQRRRRERSVRWMSILGLWLVGKKGGSCMMGQLLCYMLVQACMVVHTTLERGTMGWTARWANDITLFHVIQHSIWNSRLQMCPPIFEFLTTPMAWLVQHMMQQNSSILGLQVSWLVE